MINVTLKSMEKIHIYVNLWPRLYGTHFCILVWQEGGICPTFNDNCLANTDGVEILLRFTNLENEKMKRIMFLNGSLYSWFYCPLP